MMTTDEAIAGLDRLFTMLRRHGVGEYSDGSMRVVLTPSAPATTASPDLTQALAPSLCRCGHPKHDHSGDVGCLHGCEMRVCVPEGGAGS